MEFWIFTAYNLKYFISSCPLYFSSVLFSMVSSNFFSLAFYSLVLARKILDKTGSMSNSTRWFSLSTYPLALKFIFDKDQHTYQTNDSFTEFICILSINTRLCKALGNAQLGYIITFQFQYSLPFTAAFLNMLQFFLSNSLTCYE